MTAEEHLKVLIGDLVITLAKLSAELDAMRTSAPPQPPPVKDGP